MRLALKILKHTMIQSSSSIGSRGVRVRHEDLVPYNNATIYMAERFRNFYIDHVPRQQNAHVDALTSLAAFLALPSRATEKVLVYNHDLYCPKFTLEDNQKPIGCCHSRFNDD